MDLENARDCSTSSYSELLSMPRIMRQGIERIERLLYKRSVMQPSLSSQVQQQISNFTQLISHTLLNTRIRQASRGYFPPRSLPSNISKMSCSAFNILSTVLALSTFSISTARQSKLYYCNGETKCPWHHGL